MYNYFLKSSGLMYAGLNNHEKMVKNKMDGINERIKIRYIYLMNHSLDIRSCYAGSLFFSVLELAKNLNQTTIKKQSKAIQLYLDNSEVKECLKLIPYKGKFYTILLLGLAKLNLSYSIVFVFRISKVLGFKS